MTATSGASEPIRVVVVDDDLFVRTALGGYITGTPGLHLVGLCENGEHAVRLVTSTPVDVVLMDIQMPVLDGVGAAGQIRAANPDTHVLMLTSFDEDTSIRAALASGASGYLLKSTTPEALIGAIRAVHGGTSVMTAESMKRLAGPAPARALPDVTLSTSERDVLRLLCKGHSNAQIAAALFLSESTVKLRLASIGDKLGTSSRVTTAIRGWQLGLADDGR